jgi:hypothetical protein
MKIQSYYISLNFYESVPTGQFLVSHLNYMIYLLTAIGLSPGGSSTVHSYTQTVHRTIQNNQYTEQHNNWTVRAVPRLGELYPGICLTTEEKARENLSQGSRTIRIRRQQ